MMDMETDPEGRKLRKLLTEQNPTQMNQLVLILSNTATIGTIMENALLKAVGSRMKMHHCANLMGIAEDRNACFHTRNRICIF